VICRASFVPCRDSSTRHPFFFFSVLKRKVERKTPLIEGSALERNQSPSGFSKVLFRQVKGTKAVVGRRGVPHSSWKRPGVDLIKFRLGGGPLGERQPLDLD
jgi:hypothetical protein